MTARYGAPFWRRAVLSLAVVFVLMEHVGAITPVKGQDMSATGQHIHLEGSEVRDFVVVDSGFAALLEGRQGIIRISHEGVIETLLEEIEAIALASGDGQLVAASSRELVSLAQNGATGTGKSWEIADIGALAVSPKGLAYTHDLTVELITDDSADAPTILNDGLSNPASALLWCANAFWLGQASDVVLLRADGSEGPRFPAGVGDIVDIVCSDGRIVVAGASSEGGNLAMLDPAADSNFRSVALPAPGRLSAIAADRDVLWLALLSDGDTMLLPMRLD